MNYGLKPAGNTVKRLACALSRVSVTDRPVKHGHLVVVGPADRMERYMVSIDGYQGADVDAASRYLVDRLMNYEDREGAMFFSEDGQLRGMELAVDVSLKAGTKDGTKDVHKGHELDKYGISGREIGPKFGYACSLTACDPELTAITHSATNGRVAVIRNGRPVWVYRDIVDEYPWSESSAEYITRSYRGGETNPKSVELAQDLLGIINNIDGLDSYETASRVFPHGLLVVVSKPDVGREYCMPINGENIFKNNYVGLHDGGVERHIERAAKIEGAMFLNSDREELVATNLALDNSFPRPAYGGLRDYFNLPEGVGVKTIRAASMAANTTATMLVVRTPRPEKPFEAYVMHKDYSTQSAGSEKNHPNQKCSPFMTGIPSLQEC